MKGFLSRLGGPPTPLASMTDGDSSGVGSAFVGRQFSLSRHQVIVEEKLAEGGFALVFRVRSQLDGRFYALKRMCVNDEQAMQVCMLEVSLVRSITHRNVVRYVDHAVHQLPNGVREILLLMVYYRHSLSDLLNRCVQSGRHLSEQQVLRIFADVCSAVAQLHHRRPPVQHRDLKADNVLAAADNPDGPYVLCDFGSASERPLLASAIGVARVEEEIKKYTTLPYRSPEMINLYSGVPIDTKSDIWALGCLLYLLAYLSLPFGESSLAISSAKFSLPDNPIRSPNLRRLIGYALRPEPSDRPNIGQLGGLACRLAGRQCDDISGAETVELHQLELLPLPTSESEVREASALRRSPSTGQLQQQQQQQQQLGNHSAQKPPNAAQTSSVRQRPRPGGLLQTQQQQQQLQNPTVDLLSPAGGVAPIRHHRRLVSDTSALMLRPPFNPTLPAATPVFGDSAAAAAAPANQPPRQRVVSLEKLSTPCAPATDLLVDLDAPAAASAAAPSWTTAFSTVATAAAAPLEDSAFGDEFDKIRRAGSTNNISTPVPQPLQAPVAAQSPSVKPAPAVSNPVPAFAGAASDAARPGAIRPAFYASVNQRPQQQQQLRQFPPYQQQQQYCPAPRHPIQLMKQQVFWPN